MDYSGALYLNNGVEGGLSGFTRVYFERDWKTGRYAFRSNSNSRHCDFARVYHCWLNVRCKRTETTNTDRWTDLASLHVR